jgi:hypothetical protein
MDELTGEAMKSSIKWEGDIAHFSVGMGVAEAMNLDDPGM